MEASQPTAQEQKLDLRARLNWDSGRLEDDRPPLKPYSILADPAHTSSAHALSALLQSVHCDPNSPIRLPSSHANRTRPI